MKKKIVEREDGRYAIFYEFADEGPSARSTETPKPASTAAPSATESDVVVRNGGEGSR